MFSFLVTCPPSPPGVATRLSLFCTRVICLVLAAACLPLTAQGNPRINEIVANNKSSLEDVDGDSSDWIEIFNPGPQLNLGGYSLTDDPAQPGKWTFPDGQFLGSNAYLLVFASGKGRATLGQQLHTNFSLDSEGDYLALSDPSGTVIDEFAPAFPALKRDIGFGPGNNGRPGYLFPPTPRQANGPALTGFVADTNFSHQRGFYDAPITVTISSATPGATIRYTTNGEEPTPTSGQLYTRPVSINSTTVLRAIASKAGMVPTNVDAKSFLYTADIIQQGNMISSVVDSSTYRNEIQPALRRLPVVSLSFSRGDILGVNGIHSRFWLTGRTSERGVHFEYFDPANPEDSTHEPAGVRIHGGNSREHPKKNFRIYFRSDYGSSRLQHRIFPESPVDSFKHLLLRGGGHDAWTFRANWNNASLIRNEFLHRLQREMGQPSPYGRMVSLFLNGEYWGIYELQECPYADYNADHNGGDPADWDVIKHGAEVEDGNSAAWNELMRLAEAGISNDSEYAAIQRFIDVDNFSDALIHRIWSSDEDWLAPAYRNGQEILTFTDDKNWYVARNSRNGEEPFIFYSWDAEMSMGIPFSRSSLTGAPNSRSWTNDFSRVDNPNSPGIVYDALRRHPEFQLRFADRLHRHMFNGGCLTPGRLQDTWSPLVDTVYSPMVGESARWGLDSYSGSPRSFAYTRNSQWIPAVNWVKNQFLANRSSTVLDQFKAVNLYPEVAAPAPSLQDTRYPNPVSLDLSTTTPAATIYFTTDGNDPRTPGEQSAASLVTGEHPVEAHVPTLASNTIIGTSWRGLESPANISEWVSGTNGVGYERFPISATSYTPLIRTELVGMYQENPSAYLRYKFTIPNQAAIDLFNSLVLRMRYDDGFVAYLNGIRIASSNAGFTGWNSAASTSNSDRNALNYETFDVSSSLGLLLPGENILAIHGLNRASNSSDFLIQALLEGVTGEPGGMVSSSAVPYTGRLALDQTTRVKARTRREDGSWSALLDLLYQIGSPASFDNLRITEIHYHPSDPETDAELAISDSDNEFEFIELRNVSEDTVDLSLCRFSKGIDFQFPVGTSVAPGQYILLVNNRRAFLARYGSSTGGAIVGQFENDTSLSNKGERITLLDAENNEIFSFPFQDESPWPESPDGSGPSLVLIDPLGTAEQDLDEGSRWRASHLNHGAPALGDEWSYQLWTRRFYGPLAGSDPLLTDQTLIPGPGGLSNFILYAQGYGLGPAPAHELSILSVERIDQSDYLTLTYQLHSTLQANVTPEVSSDLQSWSPSTVPVLETDNGDGTITLTVRDSQPVGTVRARYLRLRIED